ncbi:MAG: hypothetical protein KDB05_31380, partial [Planctomycetales bacterium]|nr:hypothetical protein [Planctomycetales bacterium]
LINASVLASTHSLDSTSFLYTLIFVATIFGASVFAGDQRQENYLFFTEHGVRPRLVWFSRQVVWGVALGVLVAFAWCVQWLTNSLAPYQLGDAKIATGVIVLMFAVGQLCSILIRSNIVAVFTSAMCGLLLFFWSMFTVGLGVPWWLSAFPLPLILVAASWLYAPKWIQQRYTWRVRFFTAATIVVPLACVVAVVAAYRVHEIPAIQTSFASIPPVSNVDSPEARETAAMYAQADRLLRSKLTFNPDDGSAVARSDDEEWQKGITLFQAASDRKACRFHHWDDAEPGKFFDGSQLPTAVLAEAKMLVEKGETGTAATLYLGLLELASHYYQQDDPQSYYMSYGLAVESKLFADLPAWAASDATSHDATIEFLNQLQRWCREHEIDWRRNKAVQHAVLQRMVAMEDVAMRRYYGASGVE